MPTIIVSQDMWQTQTAHQPIKVFEFDDCLFATEVTGKTFVQYRRKLEEKHRSHEA